MSVFGLLAAWVRCARCAKRQKNRRVQAVPSLDIAGCHFCGHGYGTYTR